MSSKCLDDLGDNVLQCILCFFADDIIDLLHLSRVNKKYNGAVFRAEKVWKRAYELSFATGSDVQTSGTATAASSSNLKLQSWLDRYKARFAEEGLKRRQFAAARLLKSQSAVQILEQQVYRLAQALRHEKNLAHQVSTSLTTLQASIQAQKVQEAHTYWVPTAVTGAQGSLVVQVPQNAVEREQELKNKLAIGELECTKLVRTLSVKRAELKAAKLKLQALQP